MNQTYKEQINKLNKQIRDLGGIYRGAIKSLDIPESEFWIWYTLVTIDGRHTQQDICSMWSLPKQTVNTVITRMRLKKYAYFEAVRGTKNRKVIHLTAEGRKYGENLVLPVTKAEEFTLGKMTTEEINLVTDVFGKYIDTLRGRLGNAEK